MAETIQIRRAECCEEVSDKLILWLLRKRYAQQLESGWNRALAGVVGETKIAGEAQIKVLDGKAVEPSIIQTLHAECDDGLDLVSFRPQGGDEFARQILVEQDFHAAWSSV